MWFLCLLKLIKYDKLQWFFPPLYLYIFLPILSLSFSNSLKIHFYQYKGTFSIGAMGAMVPIDLRKNACNHPKYAVWGLFLGIKYEFGTNGLKILMTPLLKQVW